MSRAHVALAVGFLLGLGASVSMAGGNGVGSGGLNGFPASGSSSGAITPSSVATPLLQASFVDAGVVSVRGAAECDVGINGSETNQAICFNRSGGLTATTSGAAYMSYNSGSSVLSINTGADLHLNAGSGNSVVLNAGAGGGVSVTGSKTKGNCTLNGASPSTCTATVISGAICGCFATGTTAAAGINLAANVATTTLTCTGPDGSTAVVNYHCL